MPERDYSYESFHVNDPKDFSAVGLPGEYFVWRTDPAFVSNKKGIVTGEVMSLFRYEVKEGESAA